MTKHILITGAAGAIGSALCEKFSTLYPHAHLTLIDINETALQKKGLPQIMYTQNTLFSDKHLNAEA